MKVGKSIIGEWLLQISSMTKPQFYSVALCLVGLLMIFSRKVDFRGIENEGASAVFAGVIILFIGIYLVVKSFGNESS